LCATVRDATNGAPIPDAQATVWSGDLYPAEYHATTDPEGRFCLSVPPGVYHLEVRASGFLIGHLENIPVETTLDVDIPVRFDGVRLARPEPNPARDVIRLGFDLPRDGGARLEVYDALGRFVTGWRNPRMSAGHHQVEWDLRHLDGRPIPAGRYFVRLAAGNVRRVGAFTRVP
jgi:hypothetical protein